MKLVAGATITQSGVNGDLIALLAIGALALIMFSVVYVVRKTVNATFARIFGLIVVAILGVGLGVSNVASAVSTPGFTLLGAVAGYLAGAKTQVSTPSSSALGAAAPADASGEALGTHTFL
jgi:hypothetical protein